MMASASQATMPKRRKREEENEKKESPCHRGRLVGGMLKVYAGGRESGVRTIVGLKPSHESFVSLYLTVIPFKKEEADIAGKSLGLGEIMLDGLRAQILYHIPYLLF